MSTSHIGTRRPTLSWDVPPGVEGVRIEFCRTADCSSVLLTRDFIGPYGTPDVDLPTGRVFWRARSLVGGIESRRSSPVWQLEVSTRESMTRAAWGRSFDFNGDGYDDMAVWNPAGRVDLFTGSASGITATPAGSLRASRAPLADLNVVGDINGDGYSDLAVGANSTVTLYLGASDVRDEIVGLPFVVRDAARSDVWGIGDVNGDGFGDMFVVVVPNTATPDTRETSVIYGASTPPPIWPRIGSFATNLSTPAGFLAINDDVYADFTRSMSSNVVAFVGSRTGADPTAVGMLPAMVGIPVSAIADGDVNGDGLSDLSARSPPAFGFAGGTALLLSPYSFVGAPTSQLLSTLAPTVVPVGDIDNDGFSDCAALTADEIRIHRGTSIGYATTPFATLPRAAGASVPASTSTDFNRDGFDDFVITTPTSFTVVLGAATAPLMRLPMRASPSELVAF
jgi:FG-GAP-like repeat